jgi:hypothetical protein
MSRRRTAQFAWGLAALAFALMAISTVIAVSAGRSAEGVLHEVGGGVGIAFATALPVLGALVIRQQGNHLVGWLMLGIGLSLAVHGLCQTWANAAIIDDPGSLPLGDEAAWIQAWAWMPGWALATTLLVAVFPDGHAYGRQRLLAWADGIAVALVTLAVAAASWHLRGEALLTAPDNDPRMATLNVIGGVGILLIAVLSFLSLGSLVVRFRRAGPELRRQIAWVLYGVVVSVLLGAFGGLANVGDFVTTLEAAALVGGLAIAMLRYRLYDIDVVINRTLVYGALTATLVLAYLGSVLLLELVLRPLTGGSNLAIAGSTLAVAALFRPARTRIQGAVDRRFFRRKYNAARTLERFGARLRDEVELDNLSSELRAVVSETMQPAHVSLWLKVAG